MNVFFEITIIVCLATLLGILMRLLKQPLAVGYIATGILVGQYFFNVLHATEYIEVFSKIGITILLFIVGLNMSPKVMKEIGKVSIIVGIGQVILTTTVGFLIALLLGIDRIAALYIAIALTFSSTIIILKLLSDKGDLQKLYGKIAIGFLLVQDVIATFVLLAISSFSGKTETDLIYAALLLTLKGLIIFTTLYLFNEIIPRISTFIAKSQELLFLFSLAWGLSLASLFHLLGLSVEIGALIAGVTLSVTPFAYEIGSRLRPLRDFFIVLFFVLLGSQVVFTNIVNLAIPIVVLTLFVLIGNPVIMIIIMNLLGYRRRTTFLTGMTIGQVSEFSLILASLAFNLGHISKEILSLITLVAIITIAGSSYLIIYSDTIYRYTEHILKYLELKRNKAESTNQNETYEMLLFGYDRVGSDFVNAFKKLEKSFLVVDFNPASIEQLEKEHIPCRFGDAQDSEFLHELTLSEVKLAVSTIPDIKTNLMLTQKIKRANGTSIIIIICHDVEQAQELYAAGATYVIMPHYLGARFASNMIMRLGLDQEAFKEEREKHLEHIKRRINA